MRHETWLKLFLKLATQSPLPHSLIGDSLGYQTTALPCSLAASKTLNWISLSKHLYSLNFFVTSETQTVIEMTDRFKKSPELFTDLFTHWWMNRWFLIHPAPECQPHKQINCSWCFSNCSQNLTKEIPQCSDSVQASLRNIPLVYTPDTRGNAQGSDPWICWGSSILTSELSLLFLLQLFPLFPAFSIVNKRTWKGFSVFLQQQQFHVFAIVRRKRNQTNHSPFSLKTIHFPKGRTLQYVERREGNFIFEENNDLQDTPA